jgi:predicted aspartyl protease
MMQGIVDQNCEATIRLIVGNANSQRQTIDAVIDTGFTGFLTLPFSVLVDLNLRAY